MSLVKNSAYNLFSSLVPAALAFVTVPVYIHAIGEDRYGVVAIFAMLLGYFGVLDLGLSRAVAQRIAAAGGDRKDERATIFWSAALVNLGLGAAGAIAVFPIAEWVFNQQIKVPAQLRPEMLAAAPWLAMAIPIALITQVLRGAMQGAERFASLNAITTFSAVSSQLISLAVVIWITPRLQVVLPVMFATRLINLGGMGWQVFRYILPHPRPSFDGRKALDLLSFGGWVALSGLVSPLMTAFDRFLIGSMVSASAVSHYTVPYQLGERALILPGAVSDALFPRIAAQTTEEARKLAVQCMSILSALMTPAMVCAILILQSFLSLWISPEFALDAVVPGRILLAGFCVNSFAFAFFIFLQAGGRPRLVALAHVIEVIPFFGVLYLGLKIWGVPGAAVAFSIRVAADCYLLAYFSGALRQAIMASLMPIALLGCALFAAPLVRLDSPIGLALGGSLVLLSAAFGHQRLASHDITVMNLWNSLRMRVRDRFM